MFACCVHHCTRPELSECRLMSFFCCSSTHRDLLRSECYFGSSAQANNRHPNRIRYLVLAWQNMVHICLGSVARKLICSACITCKQSVYCVDTRNISSRKCLPCCICRHYCIHICADIVFHTTPDVEQSLSCVSTPGVHPTRLRLQKTFTNTIV